MWIHNLYTLWYTLKLTPILIYLSGSNHSSSRQPRCPCSKPRPPACPEGSKSFSRPGWTSNSISLLQVCHRISSHWPLYKNVSKLHPEPLNGLFSITKQRRNSSFHCSFWMYTLISICQGKTEHLEKKIHFHGLLCIYNLILLVSIQSLWWKMKVNYDQLVNQKFKLQDKHPLIEDDISTSNAQLHCS